ncbi:MinD/ParA family ATP-binding protein [Pseudonocardia acidicola]|uniref:MinD/ParA family protein n=1 Tax=Pseudonocardia acidicola TaxID=2724939 RepID=A0ABX1SL08_9PSEU|nr:MinD/ParA family protein [Pseudonocardia acidicola]NMI01655.1 MinD/ParA family protein [Pseudonocardia acidicola]
MMQNIHSRAASSWADDPALSPWRVPTGNAPPAHPAAGPGFLTHSADALSRQLFARSHSTRPRRGLRGAIYTATRGRWNPGPSAAEADRLAKLAHVRAPLAGWHTITVASMKGGIGKTTVSSLLGLTLAEYRGDRIIALDANPDAGTLAERLLGHPVRCTIRDLISREDLDPFRSLADISTYLNVAGRLQVLASEQDPAMSEAFSRNEYRKVLAALSRFFNIVITDSGTGLIHSAMAGALEATRSLVIVGAPTIDGGGRASKTLDWLIAHGFDELVRDAVVVLSCDRESRSIDRSMVIEHFAARCRAVVEIPRDPHLAEGGLIQLDQLRERTRDAALTLAAHIAEAFSWDYPVPVGFAEERG